MMMEIQIPKQTSTPQRYFIKHNWPKQAGGVFGLISHDKTNPMSLIDPYCQYCPYRKLLTPHLAHPTSDIQRLVERWWKIWIIQDGPRSKHLVIWIVKSHRPAHREMIHNLLRRRRRFELLHFHRTRALSVRLAGGSGSTENRTDRKRCISHGSSFHPEKPDLGNQAKLDS